MVTFVINIEQASGCHFETPPHFIFIWPHTHTGTISGIQKSGRSVGVANGSTCDWFKMHLKLCTIYLTSEFI